MKVKKHENFCASHKEVTRRGFLSMTATTVFMPTVAGVLMRSKLGVAAPSLNRWIYIEHGGGGGRDHMAAMIMGVDAGGNPIPQTNLGGITTFAEGAENFCAPGIKLKTGVGTLHQMFTAGLSAEAKVPGVVQVAALYGSNNTDGNNQGSITQAAADAASKGGVFPVPMTGSSNTDSGSGGDNNLKLVPGFRPIAVTNINDLKNALSVQGSLANASPQALSGIARALSRMGESTFERFAKAPQGSEAFKAAMKSAVDQNSAVIGTPPAPFDPRTSPVTAPFFGFVGNEAVNNSRVLYAGQLLMCLTEDALGAPRGVGFGHDLGGTDSHAQNGGTGWIDNNNRSWRDRLVPAINAIVAKALADKAAGRPVTKAFITDLGAGAHSFAGTIVDDGAGNPTGSTAQGDDQDKTAIPIIIVDVDKVTTFATGYRGYFGTNQNVVRNSWAGGANLNNAMSALFATYCDLLDPTGALANQLASSSTLAALSLKRT